MDVDTAVCLIISANRITIDRSRKFRTTLFRGTSISLFVVGHRAILLVSGVLIHSYSPSILQDSFPTRKLRFHDIQSPQQSNFFSSGFEAETLSPPLYPYVDP